MPHPIPNYTGPSICDGKVERMAIIYDGQVKMAHLAIVGSFSVNGVARLLWGEDVRTALTAIFQVLLT